MDGGVAVVECFVYFDEQRFVFCFFVFCFLFFVFCFLFFVFCFLFFVFCFGVFVVGWLVCCGLRDHLL